MASDEQTPHPATVSTAPGGAPVSVVGRGLPPPTTPADLGRPPAPTALPEAATATHPQDRTAIIDACQTSFRLGWHTFELRTAPTGGVAGGEELGDDLPPGARVDTLRKLIDAEVAALGVPGAAAIPSDPDGITDFHSDLLSRLWVTDYRLAKSYQLGGGIARFVTRADVQRLTDGRRVVDLAGRVRDLKSCFQPYAADAVSATMLDWSRWAQGPGPGMHADWSLELYAQGQMWRALLSGEKLATDAVQAPDYIESGRRVMQHVSLFVERILWPPSLLSTVLVVLFCGAGVGVGWSIASGRTAGVWSSMVALLGWFGVTGGTMTAGARRAMQSGGDALWQAELAGAVANAISLVPEKPDRSSVDALRVRRPARRASRQPSRVGADHAGH